MRLSFFISVAILSFTLAATESTTASELADAPTDVDATSSFGDVSPLADSAPVPLASAGQKPVTEKHTKKPTVLKAAANKPKAKKQNSKKAATKKHTTKEPGANHHVKVAAVGATTANTTKTNPAADCASGPASCASGSVTSGSVGSPAPSADTPASASRNSTARIISTSADGTPAGFGTATYSSKTSTTASNTTAGTSDTSAPSPNTNTTSPDTTGGASNNTAGATNTTSGASNTTAGSYKTAAASSNTTTTSSSTTVAPADSSPASNTTTGNSTFQDGVQVVQTQLVSDVNTTIQALSGALAINQANGTNTTMSGQATVQLMQNITANLAKYDFSQDFSANSTATALASMAQAVNETLNSIEAAASKLLSTTGGAVQYHDLQKCILQLVQDGGLHDGSSCVTKNGISITGVSTIMHSVLDTFGGGVIPSDILTQASKALDPSFTAIIPAEQYFYGNISAAFASVQAAISGELVNAMSMAEKCFKQSMGQADYKKATAAIQSCDRGTTGETVYTDMKTLYLSVANQFVGYLQPNILESVHAVADTYLSSNASAENANATQYFRDAIYNSTISVVASNAGNQVTYATALANCMNTLIGTTNPSSAANKAATASCLTKPDGPVASIRQIVYGYIQQIDGVLPPQLAAKIEQTGVANLDPNDANYTAEVSYLHQVFLQSDVGPAYVTCYETFVDCLFNNATGALARPRNTQQTCLLGNACKTAPDGSANPYAGMRRSIQARLELAGRRVIAAERTWGTARVVSKRGGQVQARETFLLDTIQRLKALKSRSAGIAREVANKARSFGRE